MIDNPPPEAKGTRDEDYDKAEADTEGYEIPEGVEIVDKEHRLPLADHEHFEDPDFDAEWNAVDMEDDSNIVGEKSVEKDFQTIGDETSVDTNVPSNSDDDEEWGEV